MKLNRKKVSLKEEQKIVTNMITSTDFMTQTKGIIQAHLLKSVYARTVAGWCIEYFEKTESAPGKDIQDIYVRRRTELQDEEEVELVSEFIQGLNDEWEESQINNTTYEVTKAKEYLKLRQLEQLRDNLDLAITEGQFEQGESYVSGFKTIKETQSTSVNLMKDAQKIWDAFNSKDETLFRLQGDLGKAIGDICRGDFILGMGGPKSGKSFSMFYLAHRAAMCGLKVLRLNFEMSENQDTRRCWQVLQGKPRYKSKVRKPFFDDDDEGFIVRYTETKMDGINGDSVEDIEKEQEKYNKYLRGGEIRSETFIEGESTYTDAVIRMDNLEYYENFTPDLIIWDYPDIMAIENNKDSHRHGIDDIYKRIRGYAQKKNCVCAAVTQVNSNSWDKDIKGKDADENKKKVNHATKVYAINTTDEEMDNGIVRIQSLYEREGKRYTQQVVVLQSLDIGRFYLDSKFRKDVIIEDD